MRRTMKLNHIRSVRSSSLSSVDYTPEMMSGSCRYKIIDSQKGKHMPYV